MDCETKIHLINWTLLPYFVREGIDSFPFQTAEEAQIFSDLLIARIRSFISHAPSLIDPTNVKEDFVASVDAELVCLCDPCVFGN